MAATWSKCKGYAALCEAIDAELLEERDNDVREDGTAAHWLAHELWEGRRHNVGDYSPNNRELNEAMFLGVAIYHNLLKSWEPAVCVLEQTQPVSQVFPGVADGTPDAFAFNPDTRTLYVGDFKYGFRPVEVWRNPQLIVYARTLVHQLQLRLTDNVVLVIVQPRAPHRDGVCRSWKTTVAEIIRLGDLLAADAAACYAPTPDCTAGPGCGDCPGAASCRTQLAAAGAAMDIAYDSTPFEPTPAQIGYELVMLKAAQKHIENRITGLETIAEHKMKRGTRIPGVDFGRRATHTRWKPGSAEAVGGMGWMFGVETTEPPKTKTVAQLRDKLPAAIIEQHSFKPVGELVVKIIDPNDAIKRFNSQ